MSRCPRESDHMLIKFRQLDAQIIGVQEDDVERSEYVNCPTCHTTLSRPCADARHIENDDGRPLCGIPDEGALLVEYHLHSDCPLCHTVMLRDKLQ